MAVIDEDGASGGGIPDLDGSVVTGGGDKLAVGRPRKGLYSLGMAFVDWMVGRGVACEHIPYLHGS